MQQHGEDSALPSESGIFHPVGIPSSHRCQAVDLLGLSRQQWLANNLADGIIFAMRASRCTCREYGEACPSYAALLQALLLIQVRRLDQARGLLDTTREARYSGVTPANQEQQNVISALIEAKASLIAGNTSKATALAENALREANHRINISGWASLGNVVMALGAMRGDAISTAIRYARELREDAVFRKEMLFSGQAAWVIAQIADAEEGRGKAGMLATRLLLTGPAWQLLKSEPAAAPWLVRLMLGQGERGLAEKTAWAARELAEANPTLISIEAASIHSTGLFQNDAAALDKASQSHIDPWARATAMEDIGVLLSGHKWDRTEAVNNLENAMHAYAEIGAQRDFSRIKNRLRQIKANTGPLDHGRLPSGIPSLTDTEYATARLVAQGFTNSQVANQMFLSQHTVAFHLRKVFRKLGVSSRVQLARAWNDLDGSRA